jgi:uncharacterized protein YhfF
MKIRFFLLVVAISVLITIWAFAEGPIPAYGPCPQVSTTEFQGQVCTDATREYRTGQWIEEEGGVFIGNASIEKYTDGKPKILIRDGRLATSEYQGKLNHREDWDSAGKVTFYGETLNGAEKLSDGIFEGNKTTTKDSIGKQTIKRDGKLVTSNFQGKLIFQEDRDSTGNVTFYGELLNGIEKLNDGVFEGNTTTARYSIGNQTIIKDGKLATSNFQGKLIHQENRDSAGKVTFYGETLGGTEKLSDGVFEGNKTTTKNQYGNQTIIRDGKLATSNFQGKLIHQENRDSAGKVTFYGETLDGVWRVSPSITLHGNMTTTRNATTGEYVVKDNRIQ